MLTQNTLNQFIAYVVSGAHVEAIQEPYAFDATMQQKPIGTPRMQELSGGS